MRSVFSRNFSSIGVLIWLQVTVFIATKILNIWFGVRFFEENFYLSLENLLSFKVWTIFTYSFLHGSLLHLAINLLLLYAIGNFLLSYELSNKKFYCLYFLGIVFGGIFWLIINKGAGILVGSSAGVSGLIIFFCHSYAEKTMTLLLFFVFPINIKARWCGYFFWWYEIVTCLLYEVPQLSQIASSAHLGGMIIGYIFFKFIPSDFSLFKIPVAKKKFTGRYNVNITYFRTESEEIKEQKSIFEIFRKLQERGINSLSPDERRILEKYESEKE